MIAHALKGLLVAATLVVAASPALAQDGKAPLVTVVTAENPQTQLMAMVLTTQAVQQGHAVDVLLCGPAGDIALVDAPEGATAPQPPRGASPQGLLRAAMDAGAAVRVCAIYLPGAGLGPEALLEGVTVASPPDQAALMLRPDAVVWSF
jgi:predicted peroxiredoxin